MKKVKASWYLIMYILLLISSCTNKNMYHSEYKGSWGKVEEFVHTNWHTSKVDSSGKSWLKKMGIVPSKPFMSIAKGNPLLFLLG